MRKVFEEPKAKNSLSALDFIINVLREHEKELTELSDRLENTLTIVTGDNVRHTLDELRSSVQVLSRATELLSEKIESQANADVCFREIIDDLKEESRREKEQVSDILIQLKSFPTKDDLQSFRRAVDAINALLDEKNRRPSETLKG